MAGGLERERKKKERKTNQGSSSEQCNFLDDKAAVFKARNAMQCPLLVLQCWQIIRRKATVRKLDDSTQDSSRPSAVSSRRARAQRVHPWRLPWRPHACRAALRVSPASKFSERYLSFPPNFTTFGHFLQPTTTWSVLTKPSSALLCKKILAPSKVGLNRKRSDFSDLPNGLQLLREKTTSSVFLSTCSNAVHAQFH